jgi:mannose-6-phosphate isomerase-like protein (cupin superfamily)
MSSEDPQRRAAGGTFKILRIAECPVQPMEAGRGEIVRIVNSSSVGAEALDLHLNRLVAGGPRGSVHRHSKADNVYIVRRGRGALTIENETYEIAADDVVYIPAGARHSLSNLGSEPLELFEIYAPAGRQFDVIAD